MAYLKLKCLLVLVCFVLYSASASSSHNNKPECKCSKAKRYLPQNQKVSFFEAWRRCLALGLRLATVTSSAESQLIKEAIQATATTTEPWWIGGTDLGQEGSWIWFSTELPVGYQTGYTNWYTGEPNNYGGNENCLDIGRKDAVGWFDANCEWKQKFVCEKVID
ncbi:ladderlectin-like [Anopheles aquasalis]|uniref:ladderlectin-like n=1 Tax=Anopheles aquasalis TaxID=42839 RepID=UPI00215A9969|nr:ladderlectin-like [Anopheles aquasalis]